MAFLSCKFVAVFFLMLASGGCASFHFYCLHLEEPGSVTKELIVDNGQRLNEEDPVLLWANGSSVRCYWKSATGNVKVMYRMEWASNGILLEGENPPPPLPLVHLNATGHLPSELSKFTLTMPSCDGSEGAQSASHPEGEISTLSPGDAKASPYHASPDQSLYYSESNLMVHFSGGAESANHISVHLLLRRVCDNRTRRDCPRGLRGDRCQHRVLEFVTPPKHAKFFCGETAIFSCSARGFPTPTHVWYRNNNSISNSNESRYKIMQLEQELSTSQLNIAPDHGMTASTSVLYIYRMREDDAGYYTCLVRNEHGSLMHHAYLAPPISDSCHAHFNEFAHSTS